MVKITTLTAEQNAEAAELLIKKLGTTTIATLYLDVGEAELLHHLLNKATVDDERDSAPAEWAKSVMIAIEIALANAGASPQLVETLRALRKL